VNDNVIHQALRDSVHEVLERMFFVDVLGESTDPAADAWAGEIAAALTFQGDPSGSFLLRLTTVAARQIAADFLGIDEVDVSDIQTSDVVRELTNMICGSVLSRIESAATFRLGEPRIVPPAEEIPVNFVNTRYAAELPNGRLIVNLGTGIPTCPQPAQSAF
jgi:CheY-specific phosphatase CheX